MKYAVQNLIDAINSDLSSIQAAKRHNFPDRTIHSHCQSSEQKFGADRHRYLNDEQEDYLASLFKLLPKFGFSVTASAALKLSKEYFKSIGLYVKLRRKWLKLFLKRLKTEIRWKKEEKLERIRALKFTGETRKGWFSLLKSTLTGLNLMDKPSQIFNRDETGFSDKTKRMCILNEIALIHI